jgi:hypothetical protein
MIIKSTVGSDASSHKSRLRRVAMTRTRAERSSTKRLRANLNVTGTRDPVRQSARRTVRDMRQPARNDTGGGLREVEVKSRAGKRTIGIPKPLSEALREHKKAQDAEREFAETE